MAVATYLSAVLAISCALVGLCDSAPAAAAAADDEFSVGGAAAQSSPNADLTSLLLPMNKRQAAAQQCQETGGYCRYHEECCSKLCLSFSYKCVSRPPQSEFTPVIVSGQNAGAQASPVEDVVNRFGDSNNSGTASGGGGAGAGGHQCAAAGGYCQRSSDCCSRTCLSFSYRCVGNDNNNGPTNIHFAHVFEVPQSLPRPENEITIEELVNRFGGPGVEDNTLPTNSVLPPTSLLPPVGAGQAAGNPKCTTTGGECNYSNECCSRLCVRIGANNQLCAEQVQQQQQKPITSSTSTTTLVDVNCLDIGSKCFAHAECCTGRCHMFLHQCVT